MPILKQLPIGRPTQQRRLDIRDAIEAFKINEHQSFERSDMSVANMFRVSVKDRLEEKVYSKNLNRNSIDSFDSLSIVVFNSHLFQRNRSKRLCSS